MNDINVNVIPSKLGVWYSYIALFVGVIIPVIAFVFANIGISFGISLFFLVSGFLSFFGIMISLILLVIALLKKWPKKDFTYIFYSLVFYGTSIAVFILFFSNVSFKMG